MHLAHAPHGQPLTVPPYADAVLVTAPTAFVTTQQAIGALQFMPTLASMKPGDAFGDPAGCLKGGFTTSTLKDLVMRQIRCATCPPSSSP